MLISIETKKDIFSVDFTESAEVKVGSDFWFVIKKVGYDFFVSHRQGVASPKFAGQHHEDVKNMLYAIMDA